MSQRLTLCRQTCHPVQQLELPCWQQQQHRQQQAPGSRQPVLPLLVVVVQVVQPEVQAPRHYLVSLLQHLLAVAPCWVAALLLLLLGHLHQGPKQACWEQHWVV